MSASTTPTVRVLACGAIDRGDDGAALQALRRVPRSTRRRWLVDEVGQLSAEHLIGDPPALRRVVIDCVLGLTPGEITDLPLAELPEREATFEATSSHALGPGRAVALAAVLGAIRQQDRFVGIGGTSFAAGSDLSPRVAASLDEFANRLVAVAEGNEPCA